MSYLSSAFPRFAEHMEPHEIVFQLAKSGKARQLKQYLNRRTKEDRKRIIQNKYNGATSLIMACVIFSRKARNSSNIGPFSLCPNVVTHPAVVFSCSLYAPLLVQTVRDQMNKSVSRPCLFHQTLLSKDPLCSIRRASPTCFSISHPTTTRKARRKHSTWPNNLRRRRL